MIEYEHKDHDGYGYWFELPVMRDESLYTTDEFLWACKSGVDFRIAKLPKYSGVVGTGVEDTLKDHRVNWNEFNRAFELSMLAAELDGEQRTKAIAQWRSYKPYPKPHDVLCIGFQTKCDASLYKLAN